MAGRRRGTQGLFLGLLIVATLATISAAAAAEPFDGGGLTSQATAQQPPITLAAASCKKDERWSPKQGACVCAKGLKREGGACVSAAPIAATVAPTPGGPEELQSAEAEAVSNVQRCLAQLGYYKGAIDGKRGSETWTAYWNFKNEHGLKGYSDLLAEPVRQKLASLCKDLVQTAAVEPPPPPPSLAQPQVDIPLVAEAGPALDQYGGLDVCLPDHLLTVLRRAHGLGVTARVCEDACLPAPRGLGPAQLEDMKTRHGVSWCSACVPVRGHLALEDVRRIERAGNLTLCATPTLQLSRHGTANAFGIKAYTKIRELYRTLPPVAEDQAVIAVIIGNRNYAKLPTSETSLNDAGAMYSFLTEHLGYRQDNIIDLRDATRADLDRVFGAEVGVEGELARLFRLKPNAKVVVYFSGLGSTDATQKENYLLPVDAEPYREERTGYALSKLYNNLSRLNAPSVLLLLETEFGRDHSSYVLPPNLPDVANSALPTSPLPTLTVISASDRGQRTLIDSTYDVGLFTRYLIEALAGSADLHPVGNGDGKIDSAELYVYTAAMVELAARKTFGLLQNPVYSSADTAVVSNAGTVAAAR